MRDRSQCCILSTLYAYRRMGLAPIVRELNTSIAVSEFGFLSDASFLISIPARKLQGKESLVRRNLRRDKKKTAGAGVRRRSTDGIPRSRRRGDVITSDQMAAWQLVDDSSTIRRIRASKVRQLLLAPRYPLRLYDVDMINKKT